ncbi:MAG: hypothetical protein P8X79_19060 [Reinekea sp.]
MQQQEREQTKKHRVRELHSELVDLDEIVNTLLIYDLDVELINSMLRYMNDKVQIGLKILPDSEELLLELKDIDRLFAKSQALLNEPKAPGIPSSDRQIFIVKRHFVRSMKLIKQLQGEGYFDDMASSDHRSRLIRKALLVEVDAYQLQGDNAYKSGEISSAANFYKHAKELLIGSDLRFPEKTQYIKNLSKKISGLYETLPDDKNTDKDSGG